MSDTPETNAAQCEGLLRTNPIPMMVVTANFARKLERERDEAREQIDNIRKMLSEGGQAVGNAEHDYLIIDMIANLIKSKNYFVRKSDSLERERDEAWKIAGRLAHFLERPAYSVDEAIARMEALNFYKKQKSQ
jgi:hypothetical protein